MPGIVGLLTRRPRKWAEAQLLRMVESVRHEPFYATGTWVDEALGVYVGWTARKGSFSEGMPLSNEHRDVRLVFSGEEFPEPGIIDRLRQKGHTVEAHRASYLVHVYEDDPAFPAALNGRFHGLVADQRCGTVTLFNDRYAMHRIYFHESADAFYFGVEAKAILEVRPDLRRAEPKSLGEFVACSCVLENRTIFRDIHILPPASAWVFRNGAPERKGVYFQPREWEEQSQLEPTRYYQELKEVISRNLPRYFNGHEPIGMTLTGGLDTRLIMAWHNPSPGSLPCYTFGGMFRDCHDVKLARRVARQCEQTHEVIPVGSEFLSSFPHYAERSIYLTEGCVDVYRSPDLYVSERGRQIAPVKVVGTYGSEIIGHAVMFKPLPPPAGLFQPEFLQQVEEATGTYQHVRRQHPVTFSAFHQAHWYHYGILALEQSQLAVRSPFLDNDFVKTVFRAPQSAPVDADIRVRLIRDGNRLLAGIPSDRGIGGSAVSRTLREFTFKAEYAYDYGMPQWLARVDHFFSRLHLERLFLGRHKQFHFRVWYRDALSDYVRQILLDSRTLRRPFLERKAVEAIVHGHLHGGRNYTSAIHKLLTLELLHRLFLDPR
jgi:asparagine synthase (glutamine-hydrolysing)